MGFGSGYTPRESEKLPPGEYEARINGARYEQTKGGTPYLAIYVGVKGHPHCRPNAITFYDRPYTGQKEMERWDEKMTEFFDAFHLPRQMTENFDSWKGAIGWVRCVPQKNAPEYSNLYPLVKKVQQEQEPSAGYAPQQAAPQQYAAPAPGAPAPAAQGGYAPPPQQGQGGDEFPEDVPF